MTIPVLGRHGSNRAIRRSRLRVVGHRPWLVTCGGLDDCQNGSRAQTEAPHIDNPHVLDGHADAHAPREPYRRECAEAGAG